MRTPKRPHFTLLMQAFPHITRETARAVKMAMINDQPAPRDWFSDGTRIARQMHAINELLEMHGVEYIKSASDNMQLLNGLEYCNAGDTYNTTVIYDYKERRFIVATVGDIIERNPRRFAE